MAVYGSLLDSFTELYRKCLFWSATAYANGEWKELRLRGTHRVVLMPAAFDSYVTKSYGHGGAGDVSYKDLLFYKPNRVYLEMGWFYQHPTGKDVYRLVGQIDWSHEAGYCAFETERVQGANGVNNERKLVAPGVSIA